MTPQTIPTILLLLLLLLATQGCDPNTTLSEATGTAPDRIDGDQELPPDGDQTPDGDLIPDGDGDGMESDDDAPACIENQPCDDNDPCTVNDSCLNGTCGGTPMDCSHLDGACGEGRCVGGECALAPFPDGTDCGENTCATLACANGECVPEQAKQDGTPCDDGDPCSTGDRCLSGECKPIMPKNCGALDDACNVGVCSDSGDCVAEAREDGTACEHDDPCALSAACDSGQCVVTDRLDCSEYDGPCTRGVCDTVNESCTLENLEDESTCDDGDPCSTGDRCLSGICQPLGAKDCSELDGPCVEGVCENGNCTTSALEDGTVCEDDNPCTITTECLSGACSDVIETKLCEDNADCTANLCDSTSGECMFPVNAGKCRIGGQCYDDGDPQPGNACLGCLALTNQEAWSDLDGEPCSDDDPCTLNDVCNGGQCESGALETCEDNLGCTENLCSEIDGSCSNPLLPSTCLIEGVCYDDGQTAPGDLCRSCDAIADATGWTLAETSCYIDGACVADGVSNPAASQCQLCDTQKATDDWSFEDNGVGCDDGNACTLDDTCQNGACESGAPKDCSDGLDCTEDACDPLDGACSNLRITGWCVIEDTCYESGQTKPGSDCLECDPVRNPFVWSQVGDTCLIDGVCYAADALNPSADCLSCKPDLALDAWTLQSGSCLIDGVCHTDGASDPAHPDCLFCDATEASREWSQRDGWCLIADVCVADGAAKSGSGGCMLCDSEETKSDWTTQPDDSVCTDNNPCTITTTCLAGACSQVIEQKVCPPLQGQPCLHPFCQPSTGQCQYDASVNEGKPCDPSDVCVVQATCTFGSCTGEPFDCSYLNDTCHEGVCSEVNGSPVCSAQKRPNGTLCDDADTGTVNDACNPDGQCIGDDLPLYTDLSGTLSVTRTVPQMGPAQPLCLNVTLDAPIGADLTLNLTSPQGSMSDPPVFTGIVAVAPLQIQTQLDDFAGEPRSGSWTLSVSVADPADVTGLTAFELRFETCPVPDGDLDADVETDPDMDPDTEADTEAEADNEPDPDTEADAESDAGM